MPSDRFTNVPNVGSSQYIVRTMARHRPYISSGPFQNLTYKERLARQQLRTASIGAGGGGFAGNTMVSQQGNFFSPQLSTDFLELPQSLREKRELFRHYYNSDELVGQAIDIHTELPLSKVRLAPPKPRTAPKRFKSPEDYGKYILSRFTRMCDHNKLFQRLITMVHHYWLDGVCLPPDELVTVSDGTKNAEDVKVGDLVLTHRGRWRPVTAVTELESEAIIHLDIARLPGPLRVTPEHPVEVLRNDAPCFVPAGEIQSDDFVRVTWPTEEEDRVSCDLLEQAPGDVHRTKEGFYVTRKEFVPRKEGTAQAWEYLHTWLLSLKQPVLRSRKDIAEKAGVELSTLNHLMDSVHTAIPFPFRYHISRGVGHEAHTIWFPICPSELVEETNKPTPEQVAPPKRIPIWLLRLRRLNWHCAAKTEIQIDSDFLYVLGYWLGDGIITRDDNRRKVWGQGGWAIYGLEDSLDYMDRVEQCLTRMLGAGSIVRFTEEDQDHQGIHVLKVIGNPAFIEWWDSQFGESSDDFRPKRVPTWVLSLPPEKQAHILAGLIDSGRGTVAMPDAGVRISTTSLNVISAARDMMLRLGAVPSLSLDDRTNERIWLRGRWGARNYASYTLTVQQYGESKNVCKEASKATLFERANRYVPKSSSYMKRDDGVYFRVDDVCIGPGGAVYNFQIAEDETFRARFVSTHNCAIYAEDGTVEVPPEIGYDRRVQKKSILNDQGEAEEREEEGWHERSTREDEELAYYQKHYAGWNRLVVLPIDRVKITTFSFTDKARVELIPSNQDRALLERAKQGDPVAQEMMEEMPPEVREHLEQGSLIPLGTDPDEGSFVFLLHGRKGADEELGHSILERCLRTLNYREKLRQAQTSIASRAMTPKRIVWAENLSDSDVDLLREQVDLALVDPDYSIVTNYEVHWEEMGARDRLLDLSVEYEQTERRLLAGLGVTESLMSGEALYSADRLKLEVINNRYLHLREIIQEYVQDYLFKPVAKRMGFVEEDEWGQEVILYPRLSFTRLPLRDSQDTFDALLNLYQKGSISIDLILETLNIDPDDTRAKIERDMFTVNDATFNEVLRAVYAEVGRLLAEKTNVIDKIADYLKLKVNPAPAAEAEGRF